MDLHTVMQGFADSRPPHSTHEFADACAIFTVWKGLRNMVWIRPHPTWSVPDSMQEHLSVKKCKSEGRSTLCVWNHQVLTPASVKRMTSQMAKSSTVSRDLAEALGRLVVSEVSTNSQLPSRRVTVKRMYTRMGTPYIDIPEHTVQTIQAKDVMGVMDAIMRESERFEKILKPMRVRMKHAIEIEPTK